jgi:hypothetical protein
MKPAFLFAVCLGVASTAAAQVLPSEPMTLASGRLVFGADAAVSVGSDDPGFFNYSDYEHNTLREVRLGVTASVRATDRLSFLGELRSENFESLWPFALYARITPLPGRRLDVQIGRIPPTFGSFTRRAYGRDNPLIGYPLAYQYLTSLRPDAVPATADELLRMRGRGWLSEFSIGNREPYRGLPLVTAFRWDTGVQVSTGWRAITAAFSVTNGSASNPRVSDDNSGKQLAARITATPATGLVLGASWARGQFLTTRVMEAAAAGADDDFVQQASGADIEYSRDRWLVRADAVHSRWQIPLAAEPLSHGRLDAFAGSVEGRVTFLPGMYAAARVEHLAFSRIAGRAATLAWDAPVSRVEIGGGYYLQRNAIARVSWQHNDREGGRTRRDRLVAAQLLFWF